MLLHVSWQPCAYFIYASGHWCPWSILNDCGAFQIFLVCGVIFFSLTLMFFFQEQTKPSLKEYKGFWREGRKNGYICHCSSLFIIKKVIVF